MRNHILENSSSPSDKIQVLSPTAVIVTRLLGAENGEMLSRIKLKLGITKEEVYQLVSEL